MTTNRSDDFTVARVDALLRSHAIMMLLRSQLAAVPGAPTPDRLRAEVRETVLRIGVTADLEALVQRVLLTTLAPYSVALREAVALLASPQARGYARGRLPEGHAVDDVLAEAGLRTWSALRRQLPDNGAAFAMHVLKLVIADTWRSARRRPLVLVGPEEGRVDELVDRDADRALRRLVEADGVDELLAVLRERGASPSEIQRLVALVVADGSAEAAVQLLPQPVRTGALNQSVSSLRRRLAVAA